ncbi:hypothetical protein GTP44_25315 [Duganella sp. FT50W]|uniref:Uncharacterized protein n=1 Tax=Duganella lactea TaxID=2692173 RepID=A0A6L8MT40_9BURK|nr:hypothetical protein [Duganella lactea]MYM85245.1 hypothetical protein [Duganella lactea]
MCEAKKQKCRLELLKEYVDKFILTIDHPTPYRGSLPYKFYFELHENMLHDMFVSSIKNEKGENLVRTVSGEKYPSDLAIIEHVANVLFERNHFHDIDAMNHRLKNLGYRINRFPIKIDSGQVSTILVSADPIDEITASIQMGSAEKEIIELIRELDDADLLVLEHVKFGSPLATIERLVNEEGNYQEVLRHMKAAVAQRGSQRQDIAKE